MPDTPREIVCAVRGGPESRKTVTHAIDLALQTGASLTFFRVMDAEFLGHATIGPLSVVYRELGQMAEFAMLILCDRARRRGVTDVDFVVRDGSVRRQLLRLAGETPAEVLVVGRPVRSPGQNVFRPAEFEGFVAELEERGGLRVVTVTPDVRAAE
jgi:nucleotide-binding universal stress UspA family protein